MFGPLAAVQADGPDGPEAGGSEGSLVSFFFSRKQTNPIGSMYGIFTYIWLRFMLNVGKYTIHGLFGNTDLR